MSTREPTPELIAAEKARCARWGETEIRNCRKALSMHPWLNSASEAARLIAVAEIVAERRKSRKPH